jgi:hypothetical protein
MPQVFNFNKHPNLTGNVIEYSHLFFWVIFFFTTTIEITSSNTTCLKKDLFFRRSPSS